MDELKVTAEIEASDQLGMLLRRVQVEASRAANGSPDLLRKQTASIVEKIDYLGCELKLIEVDGVSHAAQIRSKKPAPEGFVEVILRGGNFVSVERKGAPLHISKETYERLVHDLKSLF